MFCERCPHYRTRTLFRRKCYYAPGCPIGIVIKAVGVVMSVMGPGKKEPMPAWVGLPTAMALIAFAGLILAAVVVAVTTGSMLLLYAVLIAGGLLLILIGAWLFGKARTGEGENETVSDGHQG